MKRFNLLIVNSNSKASDSMRKTAMKGLKRTFAFQVDNMEEAEGLLTRLNIDMLLVDLDQCTVNFHELYRDFPQLVVIGACKQLASQSVPANPETQKILLKSELPKALKDELKELQKNRKPKTASFINRRRKDQERNDSSEFDFVRLVASQ